MFTGIIEEIGTIESVRQIANSMQLTIQASTVLEDTRIGDSINTNGVCLTVVGFTRQGFTVEVMPETFRSSNLRWMSNGSVVNLERALKLNDRLGGHLVTGHIDGTGKILHQWKEEIAQWLKISVDPRVGKYILFKGSIAIDGVSLTVAKVDDHSFSVGIIPHTKQVTTLTGKKPGDILNIECDIIGKYVERMMSKEVNPSGIDLDLLSRSGYL